MTTDCATPDPRVDRRRHKRRPLSLKVQLLFFVNMVMAVVTALFLVLDYHQEFGSRMHQAQSALTDEAQTILYAVLHFQDHSHREIQTYLDSVCASMRNDESPGHHIAVVLEGKIFQALAHERASSDMLSAMKRASLTQDQQAQLGDQTMVVGSARKGNVAVYVTENLDTLRPIVMRQIFWRLWAIVFLALLAGAVVHLVIVRLVARPMERLAKTVELIAQGRVGVETDGFHTAELVILANSINSMSRSLAEAQREREFHLAKARRIQEHLLPRVAAIHGVQVAHLYKPAADVAGDFYDIVQRSDQSLVLCIADVSGHGIAAALEAVVLKTLFLQATETGDAPEHVLRHVNGRFTAISLPEDFATMFVAKWDPRTRLLEYASAGHEPAYLVSSDGTRRELQSTGLPLGIDASCTWEPIVVTPSPGDRLFLVTDGLAETSIAAGLMFGRDRLRNLLSERRDAPLWTVVREVEATLLEFRRNQADTDDVTLVAIEFEGISEAAYCPAVSIAKL